MSESITILPEDHFIDPASSHLEGKLTDIAHAASILALRRSITAEGSLFSTTGVQNRGDGSRTTRCDDMTILVGPRVGFTMPTEGKIEVSYWRRLAQNAYVDFDGSIISRQRDEQTVIATAEQWHHIAPTPKERRRGKQRAPGFLLIDNSVLITPPHKNKMSADYVGVPYKRIDLPGNPIIQERIARNFSFIGFDVAVGDRYLEHVVRARAPGLLNSYTVNRSLGIGNIVLERELTTAELTGGKPLFDRRDISPGQTAPIDQRNTTLAEPLKKIELYGRQGFLSGSDKQAAPITINGKTFLVGYGATGSDISGDSCTPSGIYISVIDQTRGASLTFFGDTADTIALQGRYEDSRGSLSPNQIIDFFDLKP